MRVEKTLCVGIMKGYSTIGSLLVFIGAIMAQEDVEEPVMRRKYYSNYIHPLTNMPDSALDVETSYVFPEYVIYALLLIGYLDIQAPGSQITNWRDCHCIVPFRQCRQLPLQSHCDDGKPQFPI